MSRTFPWRSGRRPASVLWRTGVAMGNTILRGRSHASYKVCGGADNNNMWPCPERATRVEGGSIVRGAQVAMKSHVRTVVVLALAAALVALFLHNVDLWSVGVNIVRARPEWLAVSLATMVVNLAIRSLRWRYLLEPLGHTS